MGPLEVILAPLRAVQAVGRAAEDLHDLAQRARSDPDPVEEARDRIDKLLVEVETLVASARSLDTTAASVRDGGEDLLHAVRAVDITAGAIVEGGRDLRQTGDTLDAHTRELIAGGRELTEVAREMASSLRVFRAALPRLLDGLETVEELEDAVETVADTVEPLQGVAEGVGRVTARLSRGS